MNNLDPDMKQLFQLVGIDKEEQIDKDTVDFIYDFVEKSGGMEVLRKEMKQRPPPPAPPGGFSPSSLPMCLPQLMFCLQVLEPPILSFRCIAFFLLSLR